MTAQELIKANQKVIIPGISTASSSPQSTYEYINQLFEDQNERQRILLEGRELFGEASKDLADDQVLTLLTEVQFLVDSWLEEYERKVFDGKTLDELIKI